MVRLKVRKKKGKAIRRRNSTTAVGEVYQTLKNVRFFRILGLTVIVLAISSAGIYLVVLGFGLLLGFLATLETPRDRILCRQLVNGYHYLGYRVQFGASVSYLNHNFDKRILII